MLLLPLLLAMITIADESKVMLEGKTLNESSGVCVTHGGKVVWSHNDSGGKPRVFAYRRDGRFLCQVWLNDAEAIDWEDMCSFERNGKEYLAIADVGDNGETRSAVMLYIVEVPPLQDVKDYLQIRTKSFGSIKLHYPDGSHNCEAIAYDPQRKSFWLPSKTQYKSQLFECDARQLEGAHETEAILIQEIVMPLVTGGDISRDGKSLVLCSYGAGILMARNDKSQQEVWRFAKSYDRSLFKTPIRKQGESICFADDDKHLLLTSEFAPTPLFRINAP